MATVAKNEIQENLAGQVDGQLIKEMQRIEAGRIRIGAFGKAMSVFRRYKASKSLSEIISASRFWHGNWAVVIKKFGEIEEKRRLEIMREKVYRYRAENMVRETEEKFKYYLSIDRKSLWRPFEVLCFLCRNKGHRTGDCEWTFDRVAQKIKEMEENNQRKKEVAEKGVETVGKLEGRKRFGRKVTSMEELKTKYRDVFYEKGEKIKFCRVEKCKIKTKRGEKVVKKGVIVPQALKKKLDTYLLDLEERKIIRRSSSTWRNPIRAIEKPNGDIRLVSNFIALNDLVEKDPYELRNIREIINSTQGANYLTVLDLKEGFYNIEIEEEDKEKTAFEFDGRVYEWNAMVMGFKNSPQILQRVISNVLREYINNGVSVYMDDVVVYARDGKEHDRLLEGVLEAFRRNDLKVNGSKLQYRLGEVNLLGVKINGLEQTANEVKKNEALAYPKPNNLKEMRRFLGLAGWFRSFIKDFSTLTIKMTDSLRMDNRSWKWTEEMDGEFDRLKKALEGTKSVILPNYDKEFVLKTDASNVGIGAVLLQEVNGKYMPVQWASKKLTPTEKRYGISEKEMLAIFWGVKKFEYDLRGRRFKLITDHKALEQIRNKPDYANNRINRWIERIQEFDFSVEYQSPENLVGPDALSRIGEETDTKKISDKGLRSMQGKINKHVVIENNKSYWISDNGCKREMPDVDKRKEIIVNAHEETHHRGVEATYYAVKQKYYWIGMKKTIENVIKKCELCARYNRKKTGGCEFIESNGIFEKVGVDLIDLRDMGKYVLTMVDYFTRYLFAEVIEDKRSNTVVGVMERWTKEYTPEEIITDNGKEFCSKEFNTFCRERRIKHQRISVESHRSNGRVERVIRTIRDGLLKAGDGTIEDKVKMVVEKYNRTYHAGIKLSPEEAIRKQNEVGLMLINSKCGKYAERFKKYKREQFVVGQQVFVARRENIHGVTKDKEGRFLENGKVVGCFGRDSYLVKLDDGRMKKIRHYDLKGFDGEMRLPSGGGDVVAD